MLQYEWGAMQASDAYTFHLSKALDNNELLAEVGAKTHIIQNHCFVPQEIVQIIEKTHKGSDILLQNGMANLFFIYNDREEKPYLFNVVYDNEVENWVAYIYRLRNLYRSWNKGNRLFLKE